MGGLLTVAPLFKLQAETDGGGEGEGEGRPRASLRVLAPLPETLRIYQNGDSVTRVTHVGGVDTRGPPPPQPRLAAGPRSPQTSPSSSHFNFP